MMNIFENRATKIIQWITVGPIVLVYFIVALFILWPLRPVEFQGTKIWTPVVTQGGVLRYTLYFMKKNDIRPTVTRFLYNVKTKEREVVTVAVGEGAQGDHDKPIRVNIPKGTEVGEYRIFVLVSYEYFGGLRKFETKYWTDTFRVVKEEDFKKVIENNTKIINGINDKINKQHSKDEYYNKHSSGVKDLDRRIEAIGKKADKPTFSIFGGKK